MSELRLKTYGNQPGVGEKSIPGRGITVQRPIFTVLGSQSSGETSPLGSENLRDGI